MCIARHWCQARVAALYSMQSDNIYPLFHVGIAKESKFDLSSIMHLPHGLVLDWLSGNDAAMADMSFLSIREHGRQHARGSNLSWCLDDMSMSCDALQLLTVSHAHVMLVVVFSTRYVLPE